MEVNVAQGKYVVNSQEAQIIKIFMFSFSIFCRYLVRLVCDEGVLCWWRVAGHKDMKKLKILIVSGLSLMLCSCDLSQIPGLDGKLSSEDSKAIGAACRHAGRALEDCFVLNPKGHQSGIFDGWKEMNDYMLSNQIEVVKPEIPVHVVQQDQEQAEQEHHEDKAEEKITGKSAHGEKPPKKEAHAKEGAEESSAVSRPRWTPKALGAESSSEEGSKPVLEKSEKVVEEKPKPWERNKDKAVTKTQI